MASRELKPLRSLPPRAGYKPGDVMVVFGELFSRGYANGIVDEARRAGLKIIHSTVGRRDTNGALRPLNAEEVATQPPTLINIPLEAGFDLEPCRPDGSTPVDQIKHVKMSEWEDAKLDWQQIEDSRKNATARFRRNVESYLLELEKQIPSGANVLFVHTMAGGVPRAKILMPTMNRVFKGTGERHLESERFWKSDIGRFCDLNFRDVTAQTLEHLLELSSPLRQKLEASGSTVRYVAYGYHGTEILFDDGYRWQTYAPYLQGWAKMQLEDVAVSARQNGIGVTVYNCPEILTNSSSIFVGVEVPLYPFMRAMKKEGPQTAALQSCLTRCQDLLKPEFNVDRVTALASASIQSPELQSVCEFEKWPQHNHRSQMEKMLATSEELLSMHKNPKELITFVLSEEIFRATGYLMFHDSWNSQEPVYWLGHDILARALASGQTL